jgi:hypothetical protein
MATRQHPDTHSYALRVEGKAWLDDLSIEQVWAVLHSAYQGLEPNEELLFMMLMPNGEMPARCLPRCIFESSMTSPARLQTAMRTPATPNAAPLSLIYSASEESN